MAEENTPEKPKAPAGDAKPAPKPAPKPAAKAKPAAKTKAPLVDNGDGTLTDPDSGFMWKQDDAWLDKGKFYTFAQHKEYIDELNSNKFAGYDDWRLPCKAEAATLVDKTKENIDKNGTKFPLDPLFTMGRVCNTWITECTEEKVIRFDYKIGGEMIYPPSEVWSSIYAVRTAGKSEEPAAEAAPEKAADSPEAKPAAPAK